ncbi:DUF6907 domain-containing protein [Nocardioides caeni]|uniref:Uncharacterized protein n=1 Tax=Nocardioides caeni TaxID=574700 RepID=A0A4S8NQH0_9ACTN|nr:hypothetical protein [Nocardioides caeni]THV17799.1 hypothetical protein E9934_04865 [Nocardioides caeni]
MTTDDSPTWLTEPCPSWCARQHHEGDHPEDRFHQSTPSTIDAIAGTGDAVPLTSTLHACEIVVRRGRHVGDAREWLSIESAEHPQPRMALTAESAQSLTRALLIQLGHPQI